MPTKEFVVIGGTDADLWGDIDGPVDDAWARAMNARLRPAPGPRNPTAALLAEFSAALHLGPGPHPDGSPQSVHAGGSKPAKPGGRVRKAIPGGPAEQRPKADFIERGEPGALKRQLEGGGFTYQAVSNNAPHDGFMVSPYQDREYSVPADQVTPRNLREYLKRNADLLTKPDHYIGGWVDGGTAYIDVSVRTPDRESAARLAKEHKQLAFFDLAGGETVYADAKAQG
jgi:hypothetical protein